jgi:hypothetical protein
VDLLWSRGLVLSVMLSLPQGVLSFDLYLNIRIFWCVYDISFLFFFYHNATVLTLIMPCCRRLFEFSDIDAAGLEAAENHSLQHNM